MSHRDDILRALRHHKPAPVPLPEVPVFPAPEDALPTAFKAQCEAIGVTVVEASPDRLAEALAARFPEAGIIASAIPDRVRGTRPLEVHDDPHTLADVDVFLCAARLGVAENGAVWVEAADVVHRAAPFITQHLAVTLVPEHLVADMHAAYARLDVRAPGYGVFIAGPSKTADIEQALVIGAHGPRSMTVFLLIP